MKSLIKITLTLLLSVAIANQMKAQENNESTVQENSNTEAFTKIIVSGKMDVVFSPSDHYEVKAEARHQKNEPYAPEIKNKTLFLNQAELSPNAKIYVSGKNIEEITVSGVSQFTTTGTMQGEKLKIVLSGMSVAEMDIDVEDLETNINGTSELVLTGRSKNHTSKVSGASALEAKNLKTQTTNIKVSGASNSEVDATDELNGSIEGMGTIEYASEPARKNITTSGFGKINSRDTTAFKFGDKEVFWIDKDDNGDGIIDIDKSHKKHKKGKRGCKGFDGHWGGIELGINTYLNKDYQYELPENYEFLDLKMNKSIAFNLNLIEKSFSLSKRENFGFITGIGINWNNYRFENNVRLVNQPDSIWGYYHNDSINDISYTKSKLTTSYLTFPAIFEVQFPAKSDKNFHIGTGMLFGVRLGSHTKIVTESPDDNDKIKKNGDFHLSPFRYELTARVGWGPINLFANYSLGTLFRENRGPELYPFSAGIALLNF